jgi:hypothetical protein
MLNASIVHMKALLTKELIISWVQAMILNNVINEDLNDGRTSLLNTIEIVALIINKLKQSYAGSAFFRILAQYYLRHLVLCLCSQSQFLSTLVDKIYSYAHK